MHRPGLQCSIRSPSHVLRTGILIVTVAALLPSAQGKGGGDAAITSTPAS